MKNNWKIDVNVLIIFFVRDDVLRQTFEAVRQARPRRLFLWQDGPRDGREDDIEGIKRCREIVEDVDWDCEIYTKYNEKNIGCDPSIYYAYKWVFEKVDKCIFLEDDQVPNQSYFRFCKELLDKYEHDTRISHICGHNYMEVTEHIQDDYLFAPCGSGAWATWKRVADEWDGTYSFLLNNNAVYSIKKQYGVLAKTSLKTAHKHKVVGKEFWESIVGCNCLINNHLAVIPKKNLVKNIGLGQNSTHGNTMLKFLPTATQKIFTMHRHEIEFPLKHPKYVYADRKYLEMVYRIMGVGHPILRVKRRIEHILKKIFYR